MTMTTRSTRRDILKGTLALAGLGLLGMPEWVLPALAQGETVVPFTDLPEQRQPEPGARQADHRRPHDRRAVHAEGPVLHDAALRPSSRRSGDLSSEGLRPRRPADGPVARRAPQDGQHRARLRLRVLGQPPPAAGAVRQRALDGRAAARGARPRRRKPEAREFVFFGADHGEEEVEFRRRSSRSNSSSAGACREKAISAEPILAYALNGEPLTRHQGSPLRLIMPGWYGVANVKWLSEIHAQEDAYLGKFQARWYRTLQGRDDRRRDEVDRDRDHAHAAEVVHRARHRDGSRLQGAGRGAQRRNADQDR